MLRSIILSLMLVVTVSFSHADDTRNLTIEQKREISKQLTQSLSTAATPQDSIDILYNIFDISSRMTARKVALKLFEVAGRAGNNFAQNDILRQLSNISDHTDSTHVELLDLASTLPENEELHKTVTYLQMNRMRDKVRNSTEEERQKELKALITRITNDKPDDIYEQMVITYSICCLLGRTVNPTLTIHYFNELNNIAKKLPESAFFIRNLVYTRGSILYTEIGEYRKSLEFDNKLLGIIDTLEVRYHNEGRKYRNYDASRYARYMAILYNFPDMTREEVDEAYAKASYYAARDSDALETFRMYQTPDICLLMSQKKYDEVIPILLKQIPLKYNNANRNRFFKYLLEAADSTNNVAAYNYAAKEYVNYLERYIQQRDYEKYRELQILYDVYNLRSANDQLEIESRQNEVENQRTLIFIAIFTLIVLGIFFFILLRFYRKARNLSKSLVSSNDALIEESANLLAARDELVRSRDEAREASLRKNDIISNISNAVRIPLQAISEYSRLIVDCIDTQKQPFLNKYADLVEINTELLNTVIDDVTSLSELDNNRMTVSYYGVNVNQMCEMAISSMAHRVQPDVELKFIPGDPSLTVSTDPRRVEQVLICLLNNAAKFTETGSITLNFEVDNAANRIVFNITDTGIGIPADKSEVIFNRFVKLDRSTQGPGLGLTITRMIARLIGGDVRLDTTYTRGARFRFFIPISR